MVKFIVIEGADRCGKATQTKLLSESLEKKGYSIFTAEVPLKSNAIYYLIYWMLGNGFAKKFPKSFQWLQYFNRQIFQWTILPKLEKKYDYIIMDRWSLSTVVYGMATGVPEEFTEKLYNRLKTPDFTIILLGPAHKHEVEDVYEADDQLQKRVREIYKEWSITHPGRSAVIDSLQTKEKITKEILELLSNHGLLTK